MPISSNGPSAPFPTGGGFLLNSTTVDDQRDAAVVALAGGGYAVLWWSGTLNQNKPFSLRAQILDADGNRKGVRQGRYCADDCAVLTLRVQIGDEAAVDLDYVERKRAQVRQ